MTIQNSKVIKTSDTETIKSILSHLSIPKSDSHKGQNGKVLIIGGSSLFHSASIWAAEISSFLVDIVHYSSTIENNQVFLSLKKKFHNGIIVEQKDLLDYVKEDDAVLVGPGMIRSQKKISDYALPAGRQGLRITNFNDLIKIKNEGEYTYYLTKYLIENFPEKKFVFDAGALQMMDRQWLLKLKVSPIITPHQGEFEQLFGVKIKQCSQEEKIALVEKNAKEFKTTIMLKTITDIISDGETACVVEGGNQGLTKGGTGDLLAGLTTSLYSSNQSVIAAAASSILLKKSAESLYLKYGYWYNIDKLVEEIPKKLFELTIKKSK